MRLILLSLCVLSAQLAASSLDYVMLPRGGRVEKRAFSAKAPRPGLNEESTEAFKGSRYADLDGEASNESPFDDVIGSDGRVQINNTKSFPHRAVGRLSTACTGTLVGPRHVLTAGHCVYSAKSKVFYTNVTFSPARNAQAYPFGSVDWETIYVPVAWTTSGQPEFDYALIVLKDPIGKQTGWFGFGWTTRLSGENISIQGYPDDKQTGTLWQSSCKVNGLGLQTFSYGCDTAGGMSGAPAYVDADGGPVVFGVHAYGGKNANSATRITAEVYHQLETWISYHP